MNVDNYDNANVDSLMFAFLTIVVVLRRVEDLLEYNVDPILDSAHLDPTLIWKLFLQIRARAFTPQFGIFHLTGTRKCIWI